MEIFYILLIALILVGILVSVIIFFLQRNFNAKTKRFQAIMLELENQAQKKRQEWNLVQQDLLKNLDKEKNKTLSIINNFTDGLLIVNGNNKLSLINYKAEFFLEIISEKTAGKSLNDIKDSPSFEKLKKLLGENQKNLFQKEIALKENLILEVSTMPIVGHIGTEGTLVILHDITREKAMEKIKSEFISLAAHRLRTPLSAIKWTLQMFLEGDFGLLSRTQKKFMQRTYNSNERMIHLVNDILEVIRIEEGKVLHKILLLNLEELIQSVIDSYKKEIQKRKIKIITKEPEKPLPLIRVDAEKIKTTFVNLLDNALKYSHSEGEVTIAIKNSIKEVEVSLKDEGVGIPEEQQHRVFTKFFRGSNVMRMETEGTGLGLFIAKNVVEAHGGKIWFVSRENQGSTFSFVLPINGNGQNLSLNSLQNI